MQNLSGSTNRLLIIGSIVMLFLACGFATAGVTFFFLRQGGRVEERPIIVIPTRVTPDQPGSGISEAPDATLPPEEATVVVVPTATLLLTPQPSTEPAATTPPDQNAVVRAPFLSGNIVVDGDLSDWPILPNASSSTIVFSAATWNGSDDISATWRIGWTNRALYIGVEVDDDVISQSDTGNRTYLGDSLEIQFDTDLNGDFGAGISADEVQLEISAGNFSNLGEEAFRFRGTNQGTYRDDPGHSIVVGATQVGGGYIIEAEIPWQDLYLVPQTGLTLGANFNVNDNDSPGVSLQELMKSNNPNRTYLDPSTWGRLVLDGN